MQSQRPQHCGFCLSPHQTEDRIGESLDGISLSKIDLSAVLEIYTLKLFKFYSVYSLDTYSHIQGPEQGID